MVGSGKCGGGLQAYIAEAPFPVCVYHKENGGKHTAVNMAWKIAKGEFVMHLDADDEYLPHAIQFLVDTWYKIPEGQREDYWCVHGRCRNQHQQFVGDPYPDGINQRSFAQSKLLAEKCRGDKVGLMRKSVLDQYRYPVPEGVRFVTEKVVWLPICNQYRTWYTNEVIRVYYVNEGASLSNQTKSRQSFANNAWNKAWEMVNRDKYPMSSRVFIKTLVKYGCSYMLATNAYRKNNGYIPAQADAVLKKYLYLAYLPCMAASLLLRIKYKL